MGSAGLVTDSATPPAVMDALTAIRARRSISRLVEPAPTDDELRLILEAGAVAPDHLELRPFRFVVLRGSAKEAFGAVLASAYESRCAAKNADPVVAALEKERTKLGRAPLVVIVGVRRADSDKVPFTEQLAAGAAAAENILVAATALGYGSMWRTGEPCYDQAVKQELGFRPDDEVLGFLYIGTPAEGKAKPPHLPDLDPLLIEWLPPGP